MRHLRGECYYLIVLFGGSELPHVQIPSLCQGRDLFYSPFRRPARSNQIEAPTKILGSLAENPLRSLPAMGCPPTKIKLPFACKRFICRQTCFLIPQVSVTIQSDFSLFPYSSINLYNFLRIDAEIDHVRLLQVLQSSLTVDCSAGTEASSRVSSLISTPRTSCSVLSFRAFANEPPDQSQALPERFSFHSARTVSESFFTFAASVKLNWCNGLSAVAEHDLGHYEPQ